MLRERGMFDVRVPAVLGLLVAVVLLLPLGTGVVHAVQIALAVPFALVLPGYVISRAVFPLAAPSTDGDGGGRAGCPPRQRLCWVIALDLALLTLGALVLTATPAGVGRTTWIAFLYFAVGGAGLVARRREQGLAPPPAPRWKRPAPGRLVVAVAAGAIAAGAIGLGVYTEATKAEPGFSQLWMVPDPTAAAGPTAATSPAPTAPRTAQLGVVSSEDGDRDFRVEVRADGAPVQSWSFSLAPGEGWQESVEVARGARTEAVLYRGPGALPYREVWTVSP